LPGMRFLCHRPNLQLLPKLWLSQQLRAFLLLGLKQPLLKFPSSDINSSWVRVHLSTILSTTTLETL
jgi:hypothetical protein